MEEVLGEENVTLCIKILLLHFYGDNLPKKTVGRVNHSIPANLIVIKQIVSEYRIDAAVFNKNVKHFKLLKFSLSQIC